MADNEVATKKDLAEVETRLRAEMTGMETRIVDRLTELVRDIETSMLAAFHGYGKGQ